MAWVGMAHVRAQVGIRAWGLRVVVAIAAFVAAASATGAAAGAAAAF
jgi:hypothetical protein